MDPEISPRGGAPDVQIETSLKGALPCVRCRYDLRGLSVREVCPECGMPIQATLLAVVDPHATELRPLHRPWITAIGMCVWTACALGAALLLWWVRVEPLVLGEPTPRDDWPVRLILILTAMSGLGAASMIQPHDMIPRRFIWRSAVGVALYAPLVAALWRLLVELDPLRPTPFSFEGAADWERVSLRVLASLLIVLIVLCLRSSARMLAARSLVMRTGRADRQTMIALIATVGVWLIGDLIALATRAAPEATDPILSMVSTIVIAVGSGLFTIGLAWMVWDTLRLAPVLIEPSPALDEVLSYGGASPGAGGEIRTADGQT